MCDQQGVCRIVLCDDAGDFVRLVELLFDAERGVEIVGTAENGVEAIDLCARLTPDVLLLDVSMPVMDGITALPKVRDASPDTTVVMMSAFRSPAIVNRALELGAAAFIEKGKDPLALPRQVREYC